MQLKDKLKAQQKVKILILRLKPVGDTILISAAFRNLKMMYPQAEIDVVVYPSVFDVIKNNPYLNKIHVIKRTNLSKLVFYIKSFFRSYDVIIDFINNPTSTMIAFFSHAKVIIGAKNNRNFFYSHRLEFVENDYSAIHCLKMLRPLGLMNYDDYMPELFVDTKDKQFIKQLFKEKKIKKPMVGIFASAKYPTKKYTSMHFVTLGRMITQKTKFQVVYLFGNDDHESYQVIYQNLANKKNIHFIIPDISIGELSALISQLDFLITNDTGPKHIGTAFNIPTLTIFSVTNPKVWNPPDLTRFPYVCCDINCAPCEKQVCPKEKMDCMENLAPEKVFNAFQKAVKTLKI